MSKKPSNIDGRLSRLETVVETVVEQIKSLVDYANRKTNWGWVIAACVLVMTANGVFVKSELGPETEKIGANTQRVENIESKLEDFAKNRFTDQDGLRMLEKITTHHIESAYQRGVNETKFAYQQKAIDELKAVLP